MPESEPPPQEEELSEIDFADPLKRDPEESDSLPGLDPVVIVPPED